MDSRLAKTVKNSSKEKNAEARKSAPVLHFFAALNIGDSRFLPIFFLQHVENTTKEKDRIKSKSDGLE